MFCENCGNKLNDGDKFCMSCGERVEMYVPAPEPSAIMYCDECGNIIYEGEAFCTNCGLKAGVKSDRGKLVGKDVDKKSNPFIKIACVALVLIVGTAIGVCAYTLLYGNDTDVSVAETTTESTTESTTEPTTTTTTTETTTESTTDKAERPQNDSRDDLTVGAVKKIGNNTPSHAGLNLRKEPGSSTAKLCIVPEGATVTIREAYSKNNNGYIKVFYQNGAVGCEGWILAAYLV